MLILKTDNFYNCGFFCWKICITMKMIRWKNFILQKYVPLQRIFLIQVLEPKWRSYSRSNDKKFENFPSWILYLTVKKISFRIFEFYMYFEIFLLKISSCCTFIFWNVFLFLFVTSLDCISPAIWFTAWYRTNNFIIRYLLKIF